MNISNSNEIPKRLQVFKRAMVVFLIGLGIYGSLLAYNIYWQPVVLNLDDKFRGEITLEFYPTKLSTLFPRKKDFFIKEGMKSRFKSTSPYSTFCATKATLSDGRVLPVYFSSDIATITDEQRVGLFIVDLTLRRAIFCIGKKGDAKKAYKRYGEQIVEEARKRNEPKLKKP